MDYDVQVYLLSQKFMNDYPKEQYPELMHKLGRPYSCLIVDTHEDYLICIPFRSAIMHQNAYFFKDTERSKRSRSGLDYSKVVLLRDLDYLDSKKAVVDQDEYKDAIKHMDTIVHDIVCYIEQYVNHTNGTQRLHQREYARKYQFSTLPYFHEMLGLA